MCSSSFHIEEDLAVLAVPLDFPRCSYFWVCPVAARHSRQTHAWIAWPTCSFASCTQKLCLGRLRSLLSTDQPWVCPCPIKQVGSFRHPVLQLFWGARRICMDLQPRLGFFLATWANQFAWGSTAYSPSLLQSCCSMSSAPLVWITERIEFPCLIKRCLVPVTICCHFGRGDMVDNVFHYIV